MARSWSDAINVFEVRESFRHRPVSKNRTPEVLGNAPVLGSRERGCRSDWFGGTAVKQMLSVLCGGEG